MPDRWYATVYENKHDVVNEFLEKKQSVGRSERTLNAYSRVLKRFFHDEFPDVDPAEVTVSHIDEYVVELNGRGCARNTKRRYLETLSSFYSWTLHRPGYEKFTGNPAAVVLEEIPKEKKDRPDCATWANAKKIVHAISDPRDKTIAVVLAKTGARIGKVLSLREEDMDRETGTITLRNRKSGRTTHNPVDDETVDALQRYQYLSDDHPDGYVFTSIRGKQIGRTRMQRAVREAAVEADVMEEGEDRFEKKFTPHTFRTVFTSLMRNSGMPDYYTRYLRGDEDRDEMDLYTKINHEKLREAYLQRMKPLNI